MHLDLRITHAREGAALHHLRLAPRFGRSAEGEALEVVDTPRYGGDGMWHSQQQWKRSGAWIERADMQHVADKFKIVELKTANVALDHLEHVGC